MPSEGERPEKDPGMRDDLLRELRSVLDKSELQPGTKSLLLAVSGGVDSMVMLDLLHRSGHAGAVAHFDHGLRGEESRKDLELVHEASKARQLPFYPIRLEPPVGTPEKGIQRWAREERYKKLYQLLEDMSLGGIATAHHADDRLETVLMGMLRGSGFRGVIGVPSERQALIRPLTGVWKERIRSYAEEEGVPFREDPSNSSMRYLRNRIREEMLPAFKNAFPEQQAALLRSLELLEESGNFLEAMGEKEREKLLEQSAKDQYQIPKAALKESDAPRVLLFELLRPFAFPPTRVEELLRDIDGIPGARVETQEWTLIRDREYFIIFKKDHGEVPEAGWSIDGLEDEQQAPLEVSLERGGSQIPDGPWEALLALDHIRFPLTLRKVREGDRFRPFGMEKGSKTVMEHLTDRKWPVHEKEKALILCDAEGQILWVLGSTIDDRYRIEKGSEKLLRISYKG